MDRVEKMLGRMKASKLYRCVDWDPERKYYVTKIMCFFQERNRFVNCSDPGDSFYVLGQT